jgi:hypothetical protein
MLTWERIQRSFRCKPTNKVLRVKLFDKNFINNT